MNSQELRELVKAHFNLVEADAPAEVVAEEVKEEFSNEEVATKEVAEETFGELRDVNGAFTLKFPGDSLQVGDKVSVITAEGQELDAPDGTHELEDGTKIVTKGSVVEEIMSADGEKEMAEDKEEEMEEEVKEEVEMEEDETPAVEAVVEAIAEVVKEEIDAMKAELKDLKEKMEALSAEPAAEKSMPNAFTTQPVANYNNTLNSDRLAAAIKRFKK